MDRRSFAIRALGLAGCLALGLSGADASAQTTAAVEVRVGETVSFALPRLVQIIDTEDHSIATMVVTPDGQARVTGVAVGRTRIVGRDIAQLPLIFPVTVVPARP
ncbi:MAG: hypothetical protein EPO40_13840 [Myxococcaceae bacterium]|nr:MAG: hypothetical protein EPO40_13840 [Myxococcaceae bacterium]